MRHLPSWAMLAAWLSLLAAQSSGLHMHVNADGYVGTPQGVHIHGQTPHAHEDGHEHGTDHEHGGGLQHQGDKDVSSVEISGASKSLALLVWLGIGLLIILGVCEKTALNSARRQFGQRQTHLRPPLRAPPPFSFSPSH